VPLCRAELWNNLDFAIVLFSAVSSAATFVGGAFAQNSNFVVLVTCLKAMRAIRPLRLLKRATALRRVGWSIVMLVRSLGVSLVFVASVLYIFAVIGLNVFLGQLHRCSDPLLNRAQCEARGLKWITSDNNFDWAGSSFLTVLALTSRDTWAQLMLDGLSSTGEDTPPVEWNQKAFVAFYLGVVVFWWILMSNIFIGVIMRAYSDGIQEFRRGQIADLQELHFNRRRVADSKQAQREMSRMLRAGVTVVNERHSKLTRNDLPHLPDGSGSTIRSGALMVCSSQMFLTGMQIITAASTCLFFFQTRAASSIQRACLQVSDTFFLFVFGAEAVIRMEGLYPRGFFRSEWDRLNGVVVVAALFDYAFYQVLGPTPFSSLLGWHPVVIRSLQLLRTLRMTGRSRVVDTIFRGISGSVGELMSLSALVSILAISLATMTVQLFAGLCALDDTDETVFGVRCLLTEPARLLPPNKNFRCPYVSSHPKPYSMTSTDANRPTLAGERRGRAHTHLALMYFQRKGRFSP
jgi:hypothetical protein